MPRLILIVDDSPQVAANLEIALCSTPEQTALIASSGLEALRILEAGHPAAAAVITDLDMPGIDGAQLVARIRANPLLAHLPIIVSSGCTDPDAPARLLALGANAFFTKPYSLSELKTKLEQLLHA
ncbi:MAG: response regulator [Acidobacteriia bacterium]|nr:response regulator [Terriglobia bacterium]